MFQLLAVFPLTVAAVLISLLNLVLWRVAVYLTRDIVGRTFPARNPTLLSLIIAFALSAQFFLDNFHHVQVNGASIHLSVSERTAQLAYHGLWLGLLLLFFAKLVHLRIRRAPIFAGLPLPGTAVAVMLCVAMMTTGLSGRDLVGTDAYWFVRDQSIYAWTLVLLFVTAVVLAGRQPGPTVSTASPMPPVC